MERIRNAPTAEHWDPPSSIPRPILPQEPPKPKRPPQWGVAAYGFIFGVLVWTAALRLGIDAIPDLRPAHMVLVSGIVGALAARTRWRALFGIGSAVICLALLIVMYTPLTPIGIRGWVRQDPLVATQAIVVLDVDIQGDGSLTDRGQSRMIYCLQLLRQGYGKELIVARRFGMQSSPMPAIERLQKLLRFDYPVTETGLAENTHDEAIAVRLLTKERNLDRVILVSHPVHMRRAAETFERAEVRVICSPAPEGRYDLSSLHRPEDRLEAFRDWLHEAVGYQVYKMRGWL